MDRIGEITANEIMQKYNIGYVHAQSVIDEMVNIGYISQDSKRYLFLVTPDIIDNYIKQYISNAKIANNRYSFKKRGIQNAKLKGRIATILLVIRRLLISIPALIGILFVAFVVQSAVDSDGNHLSLTEKAIFCAYFYMVFIIPANIIWQIMQARKQNMKLLFFLRRPQQWTIKHLRESRKILSLLYPNKKIVIPKKYDKTIQELKSILIEKQELAQHYAEIANKTYNENEFSTAINSCISTLEWMQQFEKYGVFTVGHLPSDDIRTIREEMPLYQEKLQRRISHMISSRKVENDIDNMEGHDFEYFCADILRKNRFAKVEVTQGSGDHGIDILAEKDGISYAIQCKCYSSNVGNAAIQQAHTGKSLYHKDIAVVLTNQYFTQQAINEASALGVKLWDREHLINLIGNADAIEKEAHNF